MEKIIIVESPSKSKAIESYVGQDYKVLSSKGHICDLATSGKDGLGIDIPNGFVPNYTIMKDKEALVKDLKKQCKGKEVLLATDPDREGEAIAYHLANCLNLSFDDKNRIEFHEVTKDAVKEALESPHKVNLKMVDSQECRRMIDRILGFKLSKLLQRKIGSKSAGRVQSVALKLIVELEKEIKAFIPTKYYEIEALFDSFKLKLNELNGEKVDNKNRILDRKILEDLKESLKEFVVTEITKKEVKRNSYPTFTTSTMQQDASNKLGFNPTRTMRIAQGLYEGKEIGSELVGLITYMRTDSTRLADSFVQSANKYIISTYGDKYLGNIKIKEQKNAQDAHEGIRPTSIARSPETIKRYLSDDEYKLYSLIYNRTLASLMSPAIFASTKVEFSNTNSKWQTTGQQLLFDGFLKVYGKTDEDKNNILPNFSNGEKYNANQIDILDKETTPKPRFTEASLIKEMEEKGIGRPSTYAQTIQTLKDRIYINIEKKSLIPTEQGILTSDKLSDFFSDIINVSYTAKMEEDLDKIAKGEEIKINELTSFYNQFIPLFENATENMEAVYPKPTDEICPECGNPLVIRMGRYGEFISCSNYPSCTYIKKDKEDEPSTDTGVICPVCQTGHLVSKVASKGRNKGNVFFACSNYPKCKTAFNDLPTNEYCPKCNSMMLKDKDGNLYCSKKCDEVKEEVDITNAPICPKCQKGHLIKKQATRGKNVGNYFYACDKYPRCKNIVSEEEYLKLVKE